jgi:hypothetical protein
VLDDIAGNPISSSSPAATIRMGVYEDFYSSRARTAPDSAAPKPSLYTEYYPTETQHFAPHISNSRKGGFISVASAPVTLRNMPLPVDSAAYAGGPDPSLWQAYFPRSRLNMAPHVSIVPGESDALSQLVVKADAESAQRNLTSAAPFESGWKARWRPASRW